MPNHKKEKSDGLSLRQEPRNNTHPSSFTSSDTSLDEENNRQSGINLFPMFLNAVGSFFYMLGFYTESVLVRGMRAAKKAGGTLFQLIRLLSANIVKRLSAIGFTIFEEIRTPYRQLKKMVLERRQLKEVEGGKQTTRIDFILVFIRAIQIAFPVVAFLLLLITINTFLSMRYALAVEVGGKIIGYVQDEKVVDDARNLLRMKISLSPGQSVDDWEFTPTLSLTATNKLSNKIQIADRILERSQNNIQQATGIYVGDVVVGATKEGDLLRAFLQDRLNQYKPLSGEQAEINFVQDVRVSTNEELFLTETVLPFEDLKKQLAREIEPAQYFTVAEEETLSEIAVKFGLTLDTLRQRNPDFAEEKDTYVPEVGSVLLIKPAVPYLQVQVAYRKFVSENIPFTTEEKEDSNRPKGYQKVQTKGVDGKQMVPYDYLFIDGELVSQKRLDDQIQIITPPVTEVILLGTALPVSTGTGATGSFYFPLPNVTSSSRGYTPGGHRGVDMSAPEGSPILASDGGVVTAARYHYSYGNYVEIDHGNGFQTLYAHMSQLLVSEGSVLDQGQAVGIIGATGYSFGRHLHFEIHLDGQLIDPDPYLYWP